MKKLLTAFLGIAVFFGTATAQTSSVQETPVAQELQKNIFGAKVGLNVSSLWMTDFKSAPGAGFHIGASYERLILKDRPLYFETGLAFSLKSGSLSAYDVTLKSTGYYLELPVMVNYKFTVAPDITVTPALGFYYELGVGGKFKYSEYGYSESFDMYGDKGLLKRSDFGLRLAVSAAYKRYSVTVGYSIGFLNLTKPESNDDYYDYDWYSTRAGYDWDDWDDWDYDDSNGKIHAGNFFISFGVKF